MPWTIEFMIGEAYKPLYIILCWFLKVVLKIKHRHFQKHVINIYMFWVICFEYRFKVGFKTNTIITIVSVICEKMSK